jgi:hypothetical protein
MLATITSTVQSSSLRYTTILLWSYHDPSLEFVAVPAAVGHQQPGTPPGCNSADVGASNCQDLWIKIF